ncbi:electron transport protein [Bacillus sp. T3]|uniref:electron transport protein n=1 Tax=Bacillus sp. T3 TaxID=467262 RepID=UPI002981BA4D|nr:electron transport protein [Bacillus sp. T3]
MRKSIIIVLVLIVGVIGATLFLSITEPEFAYVPPDEKIKNHENSGIVKINQETNVQLENSEDAVQLGKKLFYQETFGNEVFFTDVLGLFNGTFTIPNITKAILKLKGNGTHNLKVEAAKTVKIGNRTIEKGELIETGLDVAKGAYAPVGVKFKYDDGRIKAGISCAVCHATVDKEGNVVQGIPNSDLNIGLTLALGTNTASYFTHTEMENLKNFIKDTKRVVTTSEGKSEALPDIEALEEYVDREIVKWPKGSNDTTIDFHNNPVQIPDAYTKGDHPYGWSGQGQIGPFKGISAAINNAHSQNMDAVSQTNISKPVLNIDKEVYLGTLLQNAANKKFRYDPKSGEKPTDFFAKVDPTPGVDGVNELIPSASFPKISFLTSIGLLSSSPGYRAWEQMNAVSAFMNSLHPMKTSLEIQKSQKDEGRRIFEQGGCISCHGGQYLTNNKLISPKVIGTNDSRAKAFKKTENYFDEPVMYDDQTPVPLPKNPIKHRIQMTKEQEEQLKLGWAHGDTGGAYKTPSLYGLYWSAPYLHDGGVAVGPNLLTDLGVPGTYLKNNVPDSRNSLLALIDSKLRMKVIAENKKNEAVKSANVTGEGHEFWIDETTGFNQQQQQALIDYLLTVTDEK